MSLLPTRDAFERCYHLQLLYSHLYPYTIHTIPQPTQRPALYDYYDKQLRIKVDDDIEQFFNPEHNIPPEYLNLLTDQESDS